MLDRNGNPLEATGNCFMNCAKFLTDGEGGNMTLVHAIVSGKGKAISGLEYSHAFLITEDGKNAIDLTKDIDDPITMPLMVYRLLGNIRNEIPYSKSDVVHELLKHKHWGPWDESLRTDVDQQVEENAS